MRGQGLHPESLRRIVSTIDDIDAQFLRQSVSPMWSFSRDERIDTFFRG